VAKYYINAGRGATGGGVRLGFYANNTAYDNIGGQFGVVKIRGRVPTNIVFGSNSPRPMKVRVTYQIRRLGTGNDETGSTIRFCDASRYEAIRGSALSGRSRIKIRGQAFRILNVSALG